VTTLIILLLAVAWLLIVLVVVVLARAAARGDAADMARASRDTREEESPSRPDELRPAP
jgi:hypothetical protein